MRLARPCLRRLRLYLHGLTFLQSLDQVIQSSHSIKLATNKSTEGLQQHQNGHGVDIDRYSNSSIKQQKQQQQQIIWELIMAVLDAAWWKDTRLSLCPS